MESKIASIHSCLIIDTNEFVPQKIPFSPCNKILRVGFIRKNPMPNSKFQVLLIVRNKQFLWQAKPLHYFSLNPKCIRM